jgi:hypothetical protein
VRVTPERSQRRRITVFTVADDDAGRFAGTYAGSSGNSTKQSAAFHCFARLLQNDVKHGLGGRRDWRARAEDGCDASLPQHLVVLDRETDERRETDREK